METYFYGFIIFPPDKINAMNKYRPQTIYGNKQYFPFSQLY